MSLTPFNGIDGIPSTESPSIDPADLLSAIDADPLVWLFQRTIVGEAVPGTNPPVYLPDEIVFRAEAALLARVQNAPIIFETEDKARGWANAWTTRTRHARSGGSDANLRYPRIREVYDCISVRLSEFLALLTEGQAYWLVRECSTQWALKHRHFSSAEAAQGKEVTNG